VAKKIWEYVDKSNWGNTTDYCSICGQPTRKFVEGRGYDGQLYRRVVICSPCFLCMESAYRQGSK